MGAAVREQEHLESYIRIPDLLRPIVMMRAAIGALMRTISGDAVCQVVAGSVSYVGSRLVGSL